MKQTYRIWEGFALSQIILVVDDEPSIRELVSYNLSVNGFKVYTADTGTQALKAFQKYRPDLIVLDLMLPELDGVEVCRQIRKKSNVPIIMLTAKDSEIDKIVGLEVGADDYITKPFSPRELVARVKAVLRRSRGDNTNIEIETVLKHGDITLDESRHLASIDGQPLDLTPKKFDLLRVFLLNKGHTLTREYLLSTIWGYEFEGETRTVDVHVRHLRQKLGDESANPRYIETVHGIGYKMKEDIS